MIESIINRIELITDPGISCEIDAFFRDKKSVLGYKLSIKDSKYFLEVELNQPSRSMANELFMSLISFIQYHRFTYYQRNLLDNSIIYELVTAIDDKEGFYCKVIFK